MKTNDPTPELHLEHDYDALVREVECIRARALRSRADKIRQELEQPPYSAPSTPFTIIEPIRLVEYSPQCLAVVGDTYPLRAELKAMGGRWNPRLSCGPGWIFYISHRKELEEFVHRYGGGGRIKQLLLFDNEEQ